MEEDRIEGNGEYGFATIDIKDNSTLFAGLDNFRKYG